MNVNHLVSRSAILSMQALKNVPKRYYATKVRGIIDDLDVEEAPVYDTEAIVNTEEINELRNKSRLWPQHYRVLHGQRPYDENKEFYHNTVWYKKRLLGKYGIDAPEINLGICWPTKEDIEYKNEYEALAYPSNIKELWKEIEEQKKEAAEAIRIREKEIDKVMSKMDEYRAVLNAKFEKKEAQLKEAKEKKERMMLEIKEEFGFNIDPRDERFKEMLEKKELEDKKRKKQEQKERKKEKIMELLKKKATFEAEKAKLAEENLQPNPSKTEPSAVKQKTEKSNEKIE